MATEKLNEGELIQVEQEIYHSKKNEYAEFISHTKKQKAAFACYLVLLILAIISFSRIPYIGSYLDAVIFDYLFGQIKYLVYLLLFIFLIFKIGDFKWNKNILNGKVITAFILIVISACLLLSTIIFIINGDSSGIKQDDIKNVFEHYNQAFVSYLNANYANDGIKGFWNSNITGGAIGELSAVLAYVFIFIFALILIVVAILLIFKKSNNILYNKFKQKIIKLFGGKFDPTPKNELKAKRKDVAIVSVSKSSIKQAAEKTSNYILPISFLNDTSVDYYETNKKTMENYSQIISNLFSNENLSASFEKIIVMPSFSEIHYLVSSQNEIEMILNNKNKISQDCNVDSFNILFKGNSLWFEFENKQKSQISLKSVVEKVGQIPENTMVIGLGYENVPLTLNLEEYNGSTIIGKNGSGSNMLLSSMLASLLYFNSPRDLEVSLINLTEDPYLKPFENIQHVVASINNDLFQAISFLTNIKNEILLRQKEFAGLSVTNLSEFNLKRNSAAMREYKYHTIVITGYDKLLKNNPQNVELLKEIITEGATVGISLIVLSHLVNNETINNDLYQTFTSRFVLQLESEYESLRMFDNYRGFQLYGLGDGYYFNAVNNSKCRFQGCYLNSKQLQSILETIKIFYDQKQKLVIEDKLN